MTLRGQGSECNKARARPAPSQPTASRVTSSRQPHHPTSKSAALICGRCPRSWNRRGPPARSTTSNTVRTRGKSRPGRRTSRSGHHRQTELLPASVIESAGPAHRPARKRLCEDRCLENYTTKAWRRINYSLSSMTIFDVNAGVSYFAYLALRRCQLRSDLDRLAAGYNTAIPSIMRTPPRRASPVRRQHHVHAGAELIQDRNTQYNISPSLTWCAAAIFITLASNSK